MADQKQMSQDDIDALLSNLTGDAKPSTPDPAPAAAKPATASAAKPPTVRTSKPPTASVAKPATASAAKPPTDRTAKPATAGAAKASGQLSQDEIDRMMAGLDASPAKPPETPPTGPLSQDDIDRMLAELGGSDPAPAPAAAAAAASAEPPPIGQLIADLGAGPAASATISTPMGQSELDKLMAGVPSSGAVTSGPSTSILDKAGPLGQQDIDRLLAELGADVDVSIGAERKKAPAPAPAPVAAAPAPAAAPAAPAVAANPATTVDALAAPAGPGAPTLQLSPDALEQLMAKHTGPGGEEAESMIDQADIDALVKQLGQTAGQGDAGEVAKNLAKHEAQIDQLLANAPAPQATLDAITVPAKPASTVAPAGPQPAPAPVVMMPAGGIATLLPGELWGARFLLAAAVVLLATCATTLFVVAGAVGRLTEEIRAERADLRPDATGYGDRLKVALGKLAEKDEIEVAKGVRWLGDLKREFPAKEAEIALELARHHRRTGAWEAAAREYGAVVDAASGAQEDPRVHLEYGDCLERLGNAAGALRQAYMVLAAERSYVGAAEPGQPARTADELGRNAQAVSDAYLAIGRLLGNAEGPVARNETAPAAGGAHAPESAHAPAPAPAHGKGH